MFYSVSTCFGPEIDNHHARYKSHWQLSNYNTT